jgi:hypothetical protein
MCTKHKQYGRERRIENKMHEYPQNARVSFKERIYRSWDCCVSRTKKDELQSTQRSSIAIAIKQRRVLVDIHAFMYENFDKLTFGAHTLAASARSSRHTRRK